MNRFFAKEINELGFVYLSKKDEIHLRNVLRVRTGDRLEIVYENFTYICEVKEIDNKSLRIIKLEKLNEDREPNIYIHLFQGLPKLNKMEEIIQHGTECGISEFTPVEMERSVSRIKDDKKMDKKLERMRLIAEEAAKQSKRSKIPTVNNYTTFREAIESLDETVIIVPYENEQSSSIKQIYIRDPKINKVNIFIGPEGGFEASEIIELKNRGANIITLGPRILRTETAGLIAAALIIHEFEQE